jgi:tRNA-binding protein
VCCEVVKVKRVRKKAPEKRLRRVSLQNKEELNEVVASEKSVSDVVVNNEVKGEVKAKVEVDPNFVIGRIEEKEMLNVCKVNVGGEVLQIVCDAPNIERGQKVVVAKIGATMPSGEVIKDAEIRVISSTGMICSAKELALPNAPEEKGILVLEESHEIGIPFSK